VRWRPGQAIVRREVWRGRVVGAWAGLVVADEPDLLALYMPAGSPLAFTDDFFGAPHPWSGRDRWLGAGVLQLQRPGDPYAVWHGAGPELDGWYVNFQQPFLRRSRGIDTMDDVLDLVVGLDGRRRWKDEHELEPWRARGRLSDGELARLRRVAASVARDLDAGRRWWGDEWLAWSPEPGWRPPELPSGWDEQPTLRLRTERVDLRPLDGSDLAWYAELRARDGFDLAAATARHREALEHWARHGFGKFAVLLDGEPAALVTLNHTGEGVEGVGAEELDLGWYTLPHLWGRGIAPEAAQAVIEWARGAGLGPLVVFLHADNGASRRVAEKLGLRRDADGRSRSGRLVEVYRLPA
jgi:RimJ/RimL family protein N-acetyltransferase